MLQRNFWFASIEDPSALPSYTVGAAIDPNAVTLSVERRARTEALVLKSYDKMNGGFGEWSDALYEESDISDASNSRPRIMRKNVSSTGSVRYVSSMPSGRTVPSASARVRSYSQQAKERRSFFTG